MRVQSGKVIVELPDFPSRAVFPAAPAITHRWPIFRAQVGPFCMIISSGLTKLSFRRSMTFVARVPRADAKKFAKSMLTTAIVADSMTTAVVALMRGQRNLRGR